MVENKFSREKLSNFLLYKNVSISYSHRFNQNIYRNNERTFFGEKIVIFSSQFTLGDMKIQILNSTCNQINLFGKRVTIFPMQIDIMHDSCNPS